MSPEETTIVVIAFAVVVVLSAVALVFATKSNRRKKQAFNDGPGHPSVPVPTDPWRRFASALAAPYARNDLDETKGARSKITPEQTYFGYASVRPPQGVILRLSKDWSVRSAASANEQIAAGTSTVTHAAATHVAGRGEPAASLTERLTAAGAPTAAVHQLAEYVQHNTPCEVDSGSLAFDIARVANLVRWAAVVGYINVDDAHRASDALGAAALAAFPDWSTYGAQYLEGLNAFTRSGRRPFAKAVAALSDDASSPWKLQPWL